MALPPGVTEVGRVAAPGGGYWLLGSDGGVFQEETQNFYGSYWSLDAKHRNDPKRAWDRIETTGEGGYAIISTNEERYEFNPTTQKVEKTPTPTNVVTQPTPTGPTPSEASAKAIIDEMLAGYGLSGLGQWAWDEYNKTQSVSLVKQRMKERPEYLQRFPGMKLREERGLSPMSEEDYLNWETETKRLFREYGMPQGFYDSNDDITKFIAGDVSPVELKGRIQDGYAVAMNSPKEMRDEAARMFGVGPGDLAAFFIDPARAGTEIERKWAEAQLSGQAVRMGFGQLNADEAARLRELGLTAEGAASAFGQLATAGQITGALPGEEEGSLSRESQLGLVGGSPAAQEEFKRRQRKRTATFEGGGSFASGQGGVSGLGQGAG